MTIPAAEPGSPAAQAAATYLARLAPNSRRFVLARLRKAAPLLAGPDGSVAWHDLDRGRITSLRHELMARGTTPSTINLTLIVLRGVARAAAELGFIAEERADELHLVRGLSVPHNRPARGRVLPPKAVAALFASCWQDHSVTGVRDLALLHRIYNGGLSTAELAGLRLDDYALAPPTLQVHPARAVRRRQVELVDDTADSFERWRATRGNQPGALFLRFRRGGLQLSAALTAAGMTHMVHERSRSAGLAPFGPQDLRRTAIHDLLELGVSLADVHQRFGFVSHMTLAARYDHRDLSDPRWQSQIWHSLALVGL
jgi:integrase